MGGILQRSGSQRDDMGTRIRKDKRQRRQELQQCDAGFDHEEYVVPDNNENYDPNTNFTKPYESWTDQYNQRSSIHANDPPGAPRSYPSDASLNQQDMMFQQRASQDLHHSYYPGNYPQSAPWFNAPYESDQQIHTRVVNPMNDHLLKTKPAERSPKRVHFAPIPSEQKPSSFQTSTMRPLQNTHSWAESHPAVPNTSESMINKPMRLSNRASMPRSPAHAPKPILAPAPLQRPVYIGIDHQATLAERSKHVTAKRHRSNIDGDQPDGLNISSVNQQTRSQFSHQAKHRKPTDSPRSNNERIHNQGFDALQPTLPLTQRPILKSTPAKRISPNANQMDPIVNDIKTLQSRNVHRQQPTIRRELKPLSSQDNRRPAPPTDSPLFLHTETSRRRIEHSHSSSSIVRTPVSRSTRQQQQQHILSTAASTANVSRIRV